MSSLFANSGSRLVPGPVRRIGVQSRSITGTMPDGNRYESALERDLMLLLQFDFSVDFYTPQPVVIQYQDRDQEWRRYTPDGLIEWRQDMEVHDPRPVLVEVKYREAFKGEWRNWRLKMRAARDFARERGWVFQVYTEREIRTPFLDNVQFLLPYRKRSSSPETEDWVLETLRTLVETDPRELTNSLYQDKWNQASIIPIIWKLIAERRIGCDLTRPLTMQSSLYSLWS